MSKKTNTSPFMLFVQDYREEHKKKGINYGNLGDAVKAADPVWRECPQTIRMKYEAQSRHLKEKGSVKFTSHGIPISMIEEAERETQECEEYEYKDIMDLVNSNAYDALLAMEIYVMDINCYGLGTNDYIVGEFSLVRFNIRDGVLMTYHEFVNPDNIPMGYVYEVKMGAERLGLEMPEDENKSNYIQLLANIIEFIKMKDQNMKILPPIFTLPEKVPEIQNFIQQMCRRAGEDETIFRVYKLDTWFFAMINALKTHSDEGYPKKTLATIQLKKDAFKYSPGTACEHHEKIDKTIMCTQAKAKRWVYTVLDSCCPVAGILLLPGKHLPGDFDLESVEMYQERRRERVGPSIAGYAEAMSSCNSSTANAFEALESANSSYEQNSTGSVVRKHEALRLPKTNYSQKVCAPELTDFNFPTLATSVGGRGRGFGKKTNRK